MSRCPPSFSCNPARDIASKGMPPDPVKLPYVLKPSSLVSCTFMPSFLVFFPELNGFSRLALRNFLYNTPPVVHVLSSNEEVHNTTILPAINRQTQLFFGNLTIISG